MKLISNVVTGIAASITGTLIGSAFTIVCLAHELCERPDEWQRMILDVHQNSLNRKIEKDSNTEKEEEP